MTTRPTPRFVRALMFAGLACLLAGCAEKPQTLGPKADSKGWEVTPSAYTAPGYKTGDATAWEAQLRKRAQSQNEYTRAVAAP
jgi:hypothetical protein